MNIEDIKTFLYVAKEKNFSRTAELLYISQSAVTARIKSLENELGCTLFDRNNSSVKLSASGELFLRYADNIAGLEEESKRLFHLSGKYDSLLTLGAPDSVWQFPLKPLLGVMHSNHPRTALKLVCEHSLAIINNVLDSIIDLGVTIEPPQHRLLETRTLWSSRYILVASPRLELPCPCFSPGTAGQFPFIDMRWCHSFSAWLGLTYRTRIYPYQTDRIFLFLNMLLGGLGVGFLPSRIASSFLESGQLIEIPYAESEKAPHEEGFLIYSPKRAKELEPYIEEFMKFSLL